MILAVKKKRSDGAINEEEDGGKEKQIITRERWICNVGYCSFTAPLLNFKQVFWAGERAEQRRGEEKAGSGARDQTAS